MKYTGTLHEFLRKSSVNVILRLGYKKTTFNKMKIVFYHLLFNFAKTFSISSSSVSAATGLLFTKVNVFLRPGPQ